jgi:WD40 repeat protein
VESLGNKVADMNHAKEEISAIKYSPDGSKLAAGSHDNYIYIYDVLQG